MKKNIDPQFTAQEKKLLKAKGVTLKSVSAYAVDEIASLINAKGERARALQALFEFQTIPSIGPRFAEDLMLLGYYNLNSLKSKEGHELLNDYEKKIAQRVDPCVEDQFRLVVHYANHPESKKQWWDFTGERKEFRSKNGYPVDRPK